MSIKKHFIFRLIYFNIFLPFSKEMIASGLVTDRNFTCFLRTTDDFHSISHLETHINSFNIYNILSSDLEFNAGDKTNKRIIVTNANSLESHHQREKHLKKVNLNNQKNYTVCDSGECIPTEFLCNGVSDCLDGSDESLHYCGCLSNEFECRDKCLDLNKRCDTFSDCSKNEDEEHCETFPCPATKFKCNNHFCIPNEFVCNFVDNCGDNSDEFECLHRKCWSGEFRCDNGQCMRPDQICNGLKNCKDGSDEALCRENDFVECASGKRVHRSSWCDGWPDCKDNHADELNCGNCSARDFRCPNSRCISNSKICDSICDCVDDCIDESGCTTKFIPNYTTKGGFNFCTENEILTCYVRHYGLSKDRCINPNFICDGFDDCEFGSSSLDEKGCFVSTCPEDTHFWCDDGRCLPKSVRCNFKIDCLNGEDEEKCDFRSCEADEFRCKNGECIPRDRQCDLRVDCTDISDEADCNSFVCPSGKMKCANGQCAPKEFFCDWRRDCADGSDEELCGFPKHCAKDEFRCSSGQCIPGKLRCFSSGKPREGCADQSHLLGCLNVTCGPYEHKCKSGPCLESSLICNKNIDCPESWDDEDKCPFQCSNSAPFCECRDLNITCEFSNLTFIPQDIEPQINRFYFGNGFIRNNITKESFKQYSHVLILNLRRNRISEILSETFSHLVRLRILDLSDNLLTRIQSFSFSGLANLKSINLKGNKIQVLEKLSFYGLSSISTLELNDQSLKYISKQAFLGLRNLYDLDLSNNIISSLDDGVFAGLSSLISLNLKNNEIQTIERKVFLGIKNLNYLWMDEFRFCCLARNVSECLPRPDEFSSCEDLMSNVLLRFCIWVLGGLAFVANLFVIIWRIFHRASNQVHSFLLINLAFGDMIMGAYLLTIAVVDLKYRGVYFIYDASWRASSLCQLSGFLSTFSSELSVFTLTVITIERFVVIKFPFRVSRLTLSKSHFIMSCVWVLVTAISALPLFDIYYFNNFYGRSGVCLALHITNEKPNGWEYSVFIFLALNLSSFSIIAVLYLLMYMETMRSHKAVRMARDKHEATIARRMTLIVVTDAACWLPIFGLGIASLFGATIPQQVFAWIAVLILPLNSAVNPLLYTFSTKTFITPVEERMQHIGNSFKTFVVGRSLSTISGITEEVNVVQQSNDKIFKKEKKVNSDSIFSHLEDNLETSRSTIAVLVNTTKEEEKKLKVSPKSRSEDDLFECSQNYILSFNNYNRSSSFNYCHSSKNEDEIIPLSDLTDEKSFYKLDLRSSKSTRNDLYD